MSKIKHYVLKSGRKHSYFAGDESFNVVGNNQGTVPLNDAQAKAFKDKIDPKPLDEPVSFEKGALETALETGEPVDGVSTGASAAVNAEGEGEAVEEGTEEEVTEETGNNWTT